jgi:hypothetical protein
VPKRSLAPLFRGPSNLLVPLLLLSQVLLALLLVAQLALQLEEVL